MWKTVLRSLFRPGPLCLQAGHGYSVHPVAEWTPSQLTGHGRAPSLELKADAGLAQMRAPNVTVTESRIQ